MTLAHPATPALQPQVSFDTCGSSCPASPRLVPTLPPLSRPISPLPISVAHGLLVTPSPVQLPELIALISSFLDEATLAKASRISQAWAQSCIPLLYCQISLRSSVLLMDSLELGLRAHGRHCLSLRLSREVNNWCSRIVTMLAHTPNLIDLEATWISADLLESVVQLKRLERLSIPRLQGYHDYSHFFSPSFRGSSRITHLNMADTDILTDETLYQITRACPYIQVLIVSGNRCLTEEGLLRWCDHLDAASPASRLAPAPSILPSSSLLNQSLMGLTALTSVSFNNCSKICADGFIRLFERSRHLRHVQLMATRVDDEGLDRLARFNPNLETINLSCCVSISDVGLRPLLRLCTRLECISFLYCPRVSVAVFFQDLWGCLWLRELRFSLNSRHMALIQNGLPPSVPAPGQGQTTTDQTAIATMALANGLIPPPEALLDMTPVESIGGPDGEPQFHETLLEWMIFGQYKDPLAAVPFIPQEDLNQSTPRPTSATVQMYRQQLVLSQIYRQIERLRKLEVLDLRDLNMPMNLHSGLWRLGRLERLRILELSGLDAPWGSAEVEWLTGMGKGGWEGAGGHGRLSLDGSDLSDSGDCGTDHLQGGIRRKKGPLLGLKQLGFKKGHGLPSKWTLELQRLRPEIDLQQTQVLEE